MDILRKIIHDKFIQLLNEQKVEKTERVFLVHGWDGSPTNAWFPWLKQQLEKNNFEVIALKMPHPNEPTIKDWVDKLKSSVNELDEYTHFVGHSIGCQTILRFLENTDSKVGSIILVAPFIKLNNLKTKEEKIIAKPWLTSPLDITHFKEISDSLFAIFSDNDPDVSIDNEKIFKNAGFKTYILKNHGHFSDDDEIIKLPVVLDLLHKT